MFLIYFSCLRKLWGRLDQVCLQRPWQLVTSGLEPSTSYTKFKTYLFPQDEASTNLMMQARSFIKNLGSSYIGDVGWRDMWALVMQRISGRNRLYAEGFQKSPSYQDWALPVSIHTNVPIRTEKTVDCHSEENEESARRKTFCAKFDGYEGVCDCEYWHAQKFFCKMIIAFFYDNMLLSRQNIS